RTPGPPECEVHHQSGQKPERPESDQSDDEFLQSLPACTESTFQPSGKCFLRRCGGLFPLVEHDTDGGVRSLILQVAHPPLGSFYFLAYFVEVFLYFEYLADLRSAFQNIAVLFFGELSAFQTRFQIDELLRYVAGTNILSVDVHGLLQYGIE